MHLSWGVNRPNFLKRWPAIVNMVVPFHSKSSKDGEYVNLGSSIFPARVVEPSLFLLFNSFSFALDVVSLHTHKIKITIIKILSFHRHKYIIIQLYLNSSYTGAGSVLDTRSRFNRRTGALGSVICGVLDKIVRLLDESLVRSLRLQTTGGFI